MRTETSTNRNFRQCSKIFTLLFVLLLSACGGDRAAISTSYSGPVNGNLTKGPTADATVEVYLIDSAGFPIGTPIATVKTDANGEFTLDPNPAPNQFLLLRTRGGNFIDESDPKGERRITLGSDQGLESILLPNATTAAISPFTQALVDKTRRQSNGTNFQSLINGVLDVFSTAIRIDILRTLPANPIAPIGETDQINYAMALGGFANIVNTAALALGLPGPSFDLVLAIAKDLSDGRLDGRDGTNVVLFNGQVLPSLDINGAIRRFRNNNNNAYKGLDPVVINLFSLEQDGTPDPDVSPSPSPIPSLTATPTASPSPSPSPTSSPTIPPSASPSPTPLATPTNAPVASASPTASPTSSPTASPAATPNSPSPTPAPTLTPTPQNNAPAAADDFETIDEDSDVMNFKVLENDSDPDNDPLSITQVSNTQASGEPQNGIFAIVNSEISYKPDPDFFGEDSAVYTISDGNGGTAVAVLTITVEPINDPPVVDPQASLSHTSTVNSGPTPIALSELSATDIDSTDIEIQYTVSSGPDCGTLSASFFTQQDLIEQTVSFNPDGGNTPCIGGQRTSVTVGLTDQDTATVPQPIALNIMVNAVCVMTDDKLTAWFTGDTKYTQGNLTYDLAHGNHAEAFADAQSGFAATTMMVNEAMNFDGVDDHFYVPPSELYELTTVSLDAWVFLRQLPDVNTPVFAALSDSYGLYLDSDGHLIMSVSGNGSASIQSPNPIPLNQWVFLAGAFDRSMQTLTLYVDGAQVEATPTGEIFLFSTQYDLTIGGDGRSTALNGLIDEAELWSKALKLADVNALYRAGRSGKCRPADDAHNDDDALSFIQEMQNGSDPYRTDTDGDGVDDGKEQEQNTNPRKRDSDEDGIDDATELEFGTPGNQPNDVLYVASSSSAGNDSNTGTSWCEPLETNTGVMDHALFTTPSAQTDNALYLMYEQSHIVDSLKIDTMDVSRDKVMLVGGNYVDCNVFVRGKVNEQISTVPEFPTVFDSDYDDVPPLVSCSDGTNDPALRVAGIDSIVKNLSLINGDTNCYDSQSQYDSYGGGLTALDANIELDNVAVEDNSARFGGGIGFHSSDGTHKLTIRDSKITRNLGDEYGGGLAHSGGELLITNSAVSQNVNYYGDGGGIRIEAGNTLCSAQLDMLSIVQNSAGYGSGGGIELIGDCHFTLSNSLLSANEASDGAGLYIGGGWSDVLLLHNKILGNGPQYFHDYVGGRYDPPTFGSGGGIHINLDQALSTAQFALFNNLLAGNSAPENGGGLFAAGDGAATISGLYIANNTISYNRAHEYAYQGESVAKVNGAAGGGIHIGDISSGVVHISDNIIGHNEDQNEVEHASVDDNIFVSENTTASIAFNNIEVPENPEVPNETNFDAGFVRDFYLQQTTPFIDTGSSILANHFEMESRTTSVTGIPDADADDIGFHHAAGNNGSLDTSWEVHHPCGVSSAYARSPQFFQHGGTFPTTPGLCTTNDFTVAPKFAGQYEAGHRVAAYVAGFNCDASGNCSVDCTLETPGPGCPEVLTGLDVFLVDTDPLGRLLRDKGDGSYRMLLKWKDLHGKALLRFIVDDNDLGIDVLVDSDGVSSTDEYGCAYSSGSPNFYGLTPTIGSGGYTFTTQRCGPYPNYYFGSGSYY